jgi:hypothetical protein
MEFNRLIILSGFFSAMSHLLQFPEIHLTQSRIIGMPLLGLTYNNTHVFGWCFIHCWAISSSRILNQFLKELQ